MKLRQVNSALDPSRFVVLGEGLAAGMGDFSLSADTQKFSFPALMARQMGVSLLQPLIQPPGISGVPGFAPWPAIMPSPLQSTVLDPFPSDPITNLSVPNFTVSDAIRTRPREPLVDRNNSQQSTINLILGARDIMNGATRPLPTQLEIAVRSNPTLALVELGYAEALQAAVNAMFDDFPLIDTFRIDYSRIVHDLRSAGAVVVVLTIPDPTDTAYFSTIESASALVKVDTSLLFDLWRFHPDDLITVTGLNEIAFQLNAASIAPACGEISAQLPARSTLSTVAMNKLRTNLLRLNEVIEQTAKDQGAILYDLNYFFKRVKDNGARVGTRTLTGDYLGGFYSLNGFYPGATGQALIANELLACLNQAFATSFPSIAIEEILVADPVAGYKKAEGPNWTFQQLTSPQSLTLPSPAVDTPNPVATSGDTVTTTTATGSPSLPRDLTYALELPDGLELVLPLNPEASYFGDAISAQNCRTVQAIQWGSGNNLLFGGLAMMDSHLSGNVRIKFTPQQGEWTTFHVLFEGVVGTDSILTAPAFYKLPGKQQLITNVPEHLSTGRLNLRTGEVDSTPGSLNIYASFFNSALFALLQVNPNFPTTPLSFPGQYGSASVRFERRPDGKLDFTFQGSTFVPLGNDTAFPLNFCGPSRQYASVPSNGTVLHPHIAITTKHDHLVTAPAECPSIPFNTVQEFTLFSADSCFGDLFTLVTPETGGPGLGRSHLLGRVQLQFGSPSGTSVPVAVFATTPGGIFAPLGKTPLAQLFPGQLSPGPIGFSESLRFPFQTYSLNDLAVIDDPFDISVGALDLRTGKLLHPLLHRGFINQNVLFALLRVEPRTPTSSFFYKGPGQIRESAGALVFEYFGEVHIPYPSGFLFPDTNLSTGFSVVDGGALDPYLWLHAIKHAPTPAVNKTIGSERSVSSRGDLFSYHLSLCTDGGSPASFEYENCTQQGKFRMHSMSWIDYGEFSLGEEVFSSITFSCFGIWTKNGAQRIVQAAAQFSTSDHVTYIGIQVGPGGKISNVNALAPATAFPIPLKAASAAGF